MKAYEHSELPPESDVIRANIQETRESMDQTLDELGQRMKPRHMLDEVLGFLHFDQADGQKIKERAGAAVQSAGRTATQAAHAVKDVVREHPIPTLLIGAGIAWAIYEAGHRSHNGHGYHEDSHDEGDERSHFEGEWESGELKQKAQQGVESAKQRIQSATHNVKQKVTTTARAVGEKATQMREQVVHGVHHGYEMGRTRFVETSQTHPLPVGLGFLAAGVLAALALPPSRKEDEWVGQVADRVKGEAKAKGEELFNRGKTVATAAAETAKKTAAEEGLTPQTLKGKIERVASETRQAAQSSAQQQGLEPKQG